MNIDQKCLAAFQQLGVPPLSQRSEEHTSELQSQSNLVCRLLLEKKKKEQLLFRFERLLDGRRGSAAGGVIICLAALSVILDDLSAHATPGTPHLHRFSRPDVVHQ